MIRALLAGVLLLLIGCAKRDYVVLYTSQDQFYAEPILKEFTEKTGIEVRTVFDTESAKTAALAHRLRAEKNNPQCDVFWSNEEMHTRLLAQDTIIRPEDVTVDGYRTRQLVFNTNILSNSNAPVSLEELTHEKWRGKVALAYPLFGTTSAHFYALRRNWGESKWLKWCEELVRNGAKVVDGNSTVVRLVGSGECVLGLTDSDDVRAGIRQNLPIAAVANFDQHFVILNTISPISGAPRRDLAEKLIHFLYHANTMDRLVHLGAIDGRYRPFPPRDGLYLDWSIPVRDFEQMSELLKGIFLRS